MITIGKLSNLYKIIVERGWREVLIRLDESLRTNYFDFSPLQTHDMGLDPERSYACRGSATEVRHMLDRIPLLPESSIIDVGSGKGRAMIAMARYPFKKIAGVEISPELVDISHRNLSRSFLRKRTEVTTACASAFDDYDCFNYFYFYNPFPVEVLRDVIAHIHASIERRPRECWLIYKPVTSARVEETITKDGVFERAVDYVPPGSKLIVAFCHRAENCTCLGA